MRRTIVFILIVVTVVFGSAKALSTVASDSADANPDSDEYDVLSALINEIYLKGDYKSIVIAHPTCCEVSGVNFQSDVMKTYLDQLKPISLETLDDYAARSKQPLTYEKRFDLKASYHIVPYSDIETLFRGDLDTAWKTFYSRYPASNGYIRFSRVGFNKARDQAIVSSGWMRGPLHGEGLYVLFEKQNGSWKVLKQVTTWIS